MSAAMSSHDAHANPDAHHGEPHGDSYYIKIWALLCVLLIASIVGPMLGIKLITLITAFGIAIVKAWMVASKFMHLNIEKKYVSMLMLTMVGALLVFWFAIAPDIMKHEGQGWTNHGASSPAHGGFATPKEGHGHAEPESGAEHH